MIVILITGVLLTIARIPAFEMLYTTRFGILLSIKIALFLVMFSSAVVVTLIIGPRLRRKLKSPVADLFAHGMTLDQLSHFDGKEGRPAYIAYRGIVYNVTNGRLWKNGLHATKHPASNDLTAVLKGAPHGEDQIRAMPQVGTLLSTGERPERPFHVKVFYFFAYMNLALVHHYIHHRSGAGGNLSESAAPSFHNVAYDPRHSAVKRSPDILFP
jgi:predicted heme/steroid binding protein